MSQSMRIAPAAGHPTSTTNTQSSKLNPSQREKGAPSVPGLPDSLRLSHNQQPSSISSTHPLESRLSQWQATQASMHNNVLRRTFGIALPLRIGMEQSIVRQSDNFRPSILGAPSRVHDDILSNKDTSLQWEDIYAGQDGLRGVVDQGGDGQGAGWHNEMERKVGMEK